MRGVMVTVYADKIEWDTPSACPICGAVLICREASGARYLCGTVMSKGNWVISTGCQIDALILGRRDL